MMRFRVVFEMKWKIKRDAPLALYGEIVGSGVNVCRAWERTCTVAE